MAELVVRISGEIKDYKEALDKAGKETENLSETLGTIAKYGAVAFAALTAEVGLSIAAFKESQQVTNQLSQALSNQGIFSKNLVARYQEQATALQRLTGISDETIVKSQTILQSYVGQQEVTESLTKAVLDFSAAKQIDAQSASELFGKALEGNTGVLKRYGIEIDDNLTRQQRLDQIIQKVSGSFGGQAEAAGKGLGALNKLKEQLGDLQEAIGERFAPLVEFVANKLTALFQFIQDNPAFVTLASTVIAGGVALAGLAVFLATATGAFIALNVAATAANITVGALLLTIAPYAVAITALGAAVGYFATRQKEVVSASDATAKKIEELRAEITKLENSYTSFSSKEFKDKTIAQIEQRKAKIAELEDVLERQAQREYQRENAKNQALNEDARRAAALRDAAKAREDNLQIQANRTKLEILKLQENNASSELVQIKQQELDTIMKLKEEHDAATRALLEQKLADEKQLEEEARQNNFAAEVQLNSDLLAANEEYQALSEEQQENFRQRNEANLRQQLLNENSARQQAALDRANIQVKEHNTFLLNQQKFGTAYALINQIMNSTIVQGTAKAFNELAQLQTSSNATLKGIGKVAATASIIIKTAESAMNIYAGFSTIPIIGPVLGVAGAAAAVAFGAEQIGKVQGAAEGGLLEGGIPGVDSIPVLAQQNELITPSKNFDEVVNAVADQRNAQREGGTAQQGGGIMDVNIMLELKDTLMDFIEVKGVERRRLGTSLAGT